MTGHWEDYVLAVDNNDGEPGELLRAAGSANHGTLWVMGVGFDPRCLEGLRRYLEQGIVNERLVIAVAGLAPHDAEADTTVSDLADRNAEGFRELTNPLNVRQVEYPDVRDRANAGPQMARQIVASDFLEGIGHVVVDISSLPSTLYFPILAALLQAAELPPDNPARFSGEVQVVVCENPRIDAGIHELGVDQATMVGGFRGALDRDVQSEGAGTRIWAPTIGEHCGPALRAVHEFLTPDDTTPILPFPAANPRRADVLTIQHQLELFERFQVQAPNIIYADERNPYDLYRTLRRLNRDYAHALAPLGPTRLVLSSHSSKLLSVGVLLAAFEEELPIVTVPARAYEVDDDVRSNDALDENRIACTWLAGEPFQ